MRCGEKLEKDGTIDRKVSADLERITSLMQIPGNVNSPPRSIEQQK